MPRVMTDDDTWRVVDMHAVIGSTLRCFLAARHTARRQRAGRRAARAGRGGGRAVPGLLRAVGHGH